MSFVVETVERRLKDLYSDILDLEEASLPFRKHKLVTGVDTILKELNENTHFKEYAMGIVNRILDTDLAQSKEQKELIYNLEILYKTVIVLYMSYLPKCQIDLYKTAEEFIIFYPEFAYDKDGDNELWYDLSKEGTRMRKKRQFTTQDIDNELISQHRWKLIGC
jgi:hypothetical protein